MRLCQALVNFLPHRFAVGQALGDELIPKIKRDRDRRVRRILRNVLPQQIELGRLATDILRIAWLHGFDLFRINAGRFFRLKFQFRWRL